MKKFTKVSFFGKKNGDLSLIKASIDFYYYKIAEENFETLTAKMAKLFEERNPDIQLNRLKALYFDKTPKLELYLQLPQELNAQLKQYLRQELVYAAKTADADAAGDSELLLKFHTILSDEFNDMEQRIAKNLSRLTNEQADGEMLRSAVHTAMKLELDIMSHKLDGKFQEIKETQHNLRTTTEQLQTKITAELENETQLLKEIKDSQLHPEALDQSVQKVLQTELEERSVKLAEELQNLKESQLQSEALDESFQKNITPELERQRAQLTREMHKLKDSQLQPEALDQSLQKIVEAELERQSTQLAAEFQKLKESQLQSVNLDWSLQKNLGPELERQSTQLIEELQKLKENQLQPEALDQSIQKNLGPELERQSVQLTEELQKLKESQLQPEALDQSIQKNIAPELERQSAQLTEELQKLKENQLQPEALHQSLQENLGSKLEHQRTHLTEEFQKLKDSQLQPETFDKSLQKNMAAELKRRDAELEERLQEIKETQKQFAEQLETWSGSLDEKLYAQIHEQFKLQREEFQQSLAAELKYNSIEERVRSISDKINQLAAASKDEENHQLSGRIDEILSQAKNLQALTSIKSDDTPNIDNQAIREIVSVAWPAERNILALATEPKSVEKEPQAEEPASEPKEDSDEAPEENASILPAENSFEGHIPFEALAPKQASDADQKTEPASTENPLKGAFNEIKVAFARANNGNGSQRFSMPNSEYRSHISEIEVCEFRWTALLANHASQVDRYGIKEFQEVMGQLLDFMRTLDRKVKKSAFSDSKVKLPKDLYQRMVAYYQLSRYLSLVLEDIEKDLK